MKNAIVIALALVSVTAFSATKMTAEQKACVKAAKMNKELKGAAKKEAIAACKTSTATEAAKTETAPATAPATK